MSMSTEVVFLRDKNGKKHQAMLKVLRACVEGGIDTPAEVDNYFGGDDNEDYPLEVNFKAREWISEYGNGYELDIDEIPEGVKTIRFYNSW